MDLSELNCYCDTAKNHVHSADGDFVPADDASGPKAVNSSFESLDSTGFASQDPGGRHKHPRSIRLTELSRSVRHLGWATRASLMAIVLLLVPWFSPFDRLHLDASLNGEEGEGVISTAIVVLIIAFLAVGMWVAFKTIMATTTTGISNQVAQLGQ